MELQDLFTAYYDCRCNKRNTFNAIAFEVGYESNLIELYDEICSGIYVPGKSIAFIVNKPVKREIFAADFRDRVVHHLILNKLNPLFEKHFINDSYACRVNKGTHFGVKRVNKFMTQCTQNYTKESYILKLDIQGFFMSINKDILFKNLVLFINDKYSQDDKALVIELCRLVIYNEPTKNCFIKGNKTDWDNLPATKSLFYSKDGCGLPIGNYTSQVFANFYMNTLDHYVKHDLGIKYYGRYVDDFVIMHPNKYYLKFLITHLSAFLKLKLNLVLHPKKIYLQHYAKGLKFLGTIIKPGRIYTASRTKANFYKTIKTQNALVESNAPSKNELINFLSLMNSYLGILKHYKTYKLRKHMVEKMVSEKWKSCFVLGYDKFILKKTACYVCS